MTQRRAARARSAHADPAEAPARRSRRRTGDDDDTGDSAESTAHAADASDEEDVADTALDSSAPAPVEDDESDSKPRRRTRNGAKEDPKEDAKEENDDDNPSDSSRRPGGRPGTRSNGRSSAGDDDVPELEPDVKPDEPAAEEDEKADDDLDDDDGDEEEGNSEVTRCLCGHQELQTQRINRTKGTSIDPGLFIQCDKCQVWQHGFCVGFSSEEEVPEVYFCEWCRPELHTVEVRPWGKTSIYIPHQKKKAEAEGRAPTRRDAGRLKSEEKRDLSDAGEDDATKRSRRKRKQSSPAAEVVAHEKEIIAAVANSVQRQRRTMNSSRDAAYEEQLKRVLEESAHDQNGTYDKELLREAKEAFESEASDPGARSRGRRALAAAMREDADMSSEDTARPKKRPKGSPLKKTAGDEGGTRSRQGTPTAEKRKKRARKPDDSSGGATTPNKILTERSKPRIPHARSTMNEMRKRVAAILEFLGRTQSDLTNEFAERQQLLKERNSRYKRLKEAEGATDVAEDSTKFESLFKLQEANYKHIELLTAKLLEWELQFGRYEIEVPEQSEDVEADNDEHEEHEDADAGHELSRENGVTA